jgi:hypothetical protein
LKHIVLCDTALSGVCYIFVTSLWLVVQEA